MLGVAITVAGMLITEYESYLKFEFGKTITKQIPPEYRAFFNIAPDKAKAQFVLMCSGVKDYCKKNIQ